MSEQQSQTQGDEPEQELVLRVPEGALIPEGASFYEGADDGRCRLIRPDGTRCKAVRAKATGLCSGHSGTGGILRDPKAWSEAAHNAKRRKTLARATLGITSRRAATPVQAARVRAQERAERYAEVIVDEPLDDPEIGSIARQRAAIAALELLYPQVTATLDLELPEEPDGVQSMGWEAMQRLAAQLLGEGTPAGTPVLADPHG